MSAESNGLRTQDAGLKAQSHVLLLLPATSVLRHCGQSTVEYAAVVAIVVAALLSMQVYIKRGVSGRLRASVDSLGEQYAPRHTTSTMALTMNSDTTTTQKLVKGLYTNEQGRPLDVMTTTTIINENEQGGGDTTTHTSNETVGPLTDTLWE